MRRSQRPTALGPRRPRSDGERQRLQRYGRAWAQALTTARRLVTEFGAARVVATGALLHPASFNRRSGVELVAWGLRADVFGPALTAGLSDPIPAAVIDGDRLPLDEAARVNVEGIELARHRTS